MEGSTWPRFMFLLRFWYICKTFCLPCPTQLTWYSKYGHQMRSRWNCSYAFLRVFPVQEHYNRYGVIYNCCFLLWGCVWLIGFHCIYMLGCGTMVITLSATFGFGYHSKCVTFVIQLHNLIGSENAEDWNVRCGCHIVWYTTTAHRCIADSFVQFGCFWCVKIARPEVGKEFLNVSLSLSFLHSHEGGRVDNLFCLFNK